MKHRDHYCSEWQSRCRCGVWRAPCRRHAEDPAVAVIDERSTIVQPVGRFDPGGRDMNDTAIGRRHRLGFECAVQGRRTGRDSGGGRQIPLRENTAVSDCVVVVEGTHAQADVERFLQCQADGRSRKARLFIVRSQIHPHILSDLLDAQSPRRHNVCLHFVGRGPFASRNCSDVRPSPCRAASTYAASGSGSGG